MHPALASPLCSFERGVWGLLSLLSLELGIYLTLDRIHGLSLGWGFSFARPFIVLRILDQTCVGMIVMEV